MHIEIVGTGRAAGALALASHRSGHTITGVRGRSDEAVTRIAALVGSTEGHPDLRLVAVSDGAIPVLAEQLVSADPIPTVHLSGSVSIHSLDPLATIGIPVGSLHPLQTLPDAETGAANLAGAWMAVTATEPLASTLDEFAESLGCRPFRLADEDKVLYHAAASAASNYTNAALELAYRLMTAADVPFESTRPLVEAAIANAYALGPMNARTGPIARGDRETVNRQMEAVDRVGVAEFIAFRSMTEAAITLSSMSQEQDQ
ncbi:MAG: Rossmann-like and DUF2520 domain-containing protein [Acidimicrobiia bacterium]